MPKSELNIISHAKRVVNVFFFGSFSFFGNHVLLLTGGVAVMLSFLLFVSFRQCFVCYFNRTVKMNEKKKLKEVFI